MNSVLRKVVSLVGAFGIVGPHFGHEAELLLSGAKPIGLFSVADCPDEILSSELRQEKAAVRILDAAVAEGRLSKCIVVSPPRPQLPFTFVNSFFCQPGLEPEMRAIAHFHEEVWNARPPPELPKDVGALLGYTEADVKLFNRGGYDALPVGLRILMKKTHSIRQAARIASMRPPEGDF